MNQQHILDAMTEQARERIAEAAVSTQLLDTLRAATPEQRTAWLRTASDDEIRRLAECYATEEGSIVDHFDKNYAYLLRRQAELCADDAATAAPATLPPFALIDAAGAELAAAAQEANDRANMNAINKAILQYSSGVLPLLTTGGDWLIESKTRGNVVHRVRQLGGVWCCGCEAGAHGKPCWHSALLQIIDHAWTLMAEQDRDEVVTGNADDEAEEVTFLVTTYERMSFGARLARARDGFAA
jgi:hypothetical protein